MVNYLVYLKQPERVINSMPLGLLGSHVHKQRLLNKYDPLGSPQQQQQQPPQSHSHNNFNQQNNRLGNHFAQNLSVDDDLG